jgi:uncharacterized protein YjbI with pentapeptide repeats
MTPTKYITQSDLNARIKLHTRWLGDNGNSGAALGLRGLYGARLVFKSPRMDYACFSEVHFPNANFRNTVLLNAWFNGADLSNADFTNADFTNATLAGSVMRSVVLKQACLRRVDFSGACLAHADLTNADVTDVDWSDTNLVGINLSGVRGLGFVPSVRDIDAKILEQLASQWNGCAIAVRRAERVVALAGRKGHALQERFGELVAASLIYAKSQIDVPDLRTTSAVALADIQARVERHRQAGTSS